jgi:copper resistance protein B
MKAIIQAALGRTALACAAVLFPSAGFAAEMDQMFSFLQVDEFEYRAANGGNTLNWDAQGWIGGDDHKAWFKTEGEKIRDGRLESAEVQLLYSRRISDFFDAQAGVRYDFRPRPERVFAVLGVQGLSQYFFEVDAAAFISDRGEVSARLTGEYDLLITQKLILQPKAEINLAVQDVPARDIGSGLNTVALGLRLRYEFASEFAPYIGVNWERLIGETARFARAGHEPVDTPSFVAGVRFWF